MDRAPTTRAEQRQQTKARILEAARELFAQRGYERTTIRAIAQAAHVDPGLVIHYHSSKLALFTAVTAQPIIAEPAAANPGQAAEYLLQGLTARMTAEPVASLAMIRSMLTHPEAMTDTRAAITQELHRVAAGIGGDDAVLRASIANAMIMGLVIGRHQLQLDGLRNADPTAIAEILRPVFASITQHHDKQPPNQG